MQKRQRRQKDGVKYSVILFRITSQITIRFKCEIQIPKKASCGRLLAGAHYNSNQPEANWTSG